MQQRTSQIEDPGRSSKLESEKTYKKTTVMQYETFESSSGEEMAHGLLESEALSFKNLEKRPTSQEKETKRIER